MSLSIRRARPDDIPQLTERLLEQTQRRQAAAPALWPVASDAREKIERVVAADLASAPPAPPQLWLVAEDAGAIAGAVHAMIISPPPIYDVEGTPGLIRNDSFLAAGAPPELAEKLLAAVEAEVRAAGGGALIGACEMDGPWRDALVAAGYDDVTLYMAKPRAPEGLTPGARAATAGDVSDIVALSAVHRATLQRLNSRFWRMHPDADRRFELWMRHSLTLADRDMLVVGPVGAIAGYVIAQPITALHMPAGHDLAAVGIVDDFYAADFAEVAGDAEQGGAAEALLTAAECAFGRRGIGAAFAVCPAAWASKVDMLERSGYRAALAWMLKRA